LSIPNPKEDHQIVEVLVAALALQEEEPDEQEEEELVWLVVVLDEPVNMYVCDFWKKH
jgi:hypothetical protein